MILIINICKEEMHYLEFVAPVADILSKNNFEFITKSYLKLTAIDISASSKIIICGTSLKDFDYITYASKFEFLKDYDKPVFAICGGMQLLSSSYGCNFVKHTEIGLKKISFNSEFLKFSGETEAYLLHNLAIKNDSKIKKSFMIYSDASLSRNNFVYALKHKTLPHYGVLFHPEVRMKEMIVNFLYL